MLLGLKRTAVVATVAALALTGCSSAANDGSSGGAVHELVLGGGVAPATYEAANMNWGHQSVFAQAVYDGLLKANPNGVDVEPSLATEWEYDETQTVLTLKLRDDVVFTDGTPFNADVAVRNLLRFRDGSSPQKVKFRDVEDVRAVDETTVEIQLSRPNPAFLIYLTQVAGLQASPESFDNPDAQTNPVGSGPYVLDTASTVVGTTYVYTRNPDYWDADNVPYDRLTVKVFTDVTSMLNALRGGQLNAAPLADNSILPEVERAGFDVHPQFLGMAGLMLFDRGGKVNPALGDVRVRRAINYAIDKDAFLQAAALGYGELGQQAFREGSEAHDESLDDTYPNDPDKARRLLAEAGYESGFELVMPTTPAFGNSLTALIQQQLGEVGIRTKFVDVGQNLIPDLLAGKYAAAYFLLQQDPIPYQVIDFMLAPDATWNVFKYDDPEATALIEKARSATGAEAERALRDLNAYVVDQAWFNKWYTIQGTFVTDAKTEVTVNQGNVYPYLWDITPEA
jgi:peptide/nickel transport system substrate-binding protein